MPNSLINEPSPYLRQHAHNPVDWRAWGDEAFGEARRRDVPIFLSIGYSTCYWCHVMERESFESVAIARMLNEYFVCIKVDREQRPDVDDICMMATIISTGRGGWPMSLFLEPENLRPFFAGTYFPPEPRHNVPGFPQVIDSVSAAWRDRRSDVLETAASLADAVGMQMRAQAEPVAVGPAHVTQGAGAILQMLDRVHGGFGGAPKFPQASMLEFLLDVRLGAGDADTAAAIDNALRLTLDHIAIGGMHDQVGGGFHRYSVDASWTVPHFEKMLYDNAQLASVYVRAGGMYGDGYYTHVARRAIEYAIREMRSPEGAFFSAQDAEVDGHEGLNYLWTPEQVREALPADLADFALAAYGLAGPPNFKDPHDPAAAPMHVLRLEARPDAVAAKLGVDESTFADMLARANAALLHIRNDRKQPHKDDKIITSWNGLMIEALAMSGDDDHITVAEQTADFLLNSMLNGDELMRMYAGGAASTPGFLEDHAFLAKGLLALHRARGGGDGRYLDAAVRITAIAREQFGDASGVLYDAHAGQADLFVRTRTTNDGATPSGSSAMLHAMIDAYEITGERAHLDDAVGVLASLSAQIAHNPLGPVNATRALLRLLASPEAASMPVFAGAEPVPERESAELPTPVRVFADTDRVTVKEGSPAAFTIRLDIPSGFHVVSPDPGDMAEQLAPLRVHAVGGSGIAVYADYPAGEAYGEGESAIRVYTGQVDIPVVVERAGEWSGKPLVALTCQPCSQTECRPRMTIELDIALDEG